MITLRLLGGISIDGGEHDPVSGPATQRRRLALLALLAAHRGTGLSRDKLIAYLWPEADARQGRHRLSHSVYQLRQALGSDAILSLGSDALRLGPALASVDLWDFLDAVEGGEPERAAGLYAGAFLDGCFISDAPEFERWVEGERQRLAEAYASALEHSAQRWEAAGDARAAVHFWRRLAAHDPYCSRTALRLGRALVQAGDRGGALQHTRAHSARLRDDLGVAPDSELDAFVEELDRATPTRGVAGRGREAPAVAAPTRSPVGDPARPGENALVRPHAPADAPGLAVDRTGPDRQEQQSLRSGSSTPHRRLLAVGLPILIILLGIAGLRAGLSWRGGEQTGSTVAVLPFAHLSPDSAHAYLADGITEDILSHLSRIGSLRVISRTSVLPYRDTDKDLRRIGRELGATHVVEGTVRREGERVRVTAQLIDARTDHHLWSGRFDRTISDLLVIESEIAQHISDSLHTQLSPGQGRRIGALPPWDPAAYDLYLRGRDYYNRFKQADNEVAIDFFRRAIEVDPAFALGQAGLADAYAQKASRFGQGAQWADSGVVAARKAVSLAPALAEGHKALGLALSMSGRHGEALQEYQRAVALDPNLEPAIHNIGSEYHHLGRHDEALRWFQRSAALRPGVALDPAGMGLQYTLLGLHGDAERALKRSLALQPDLPIAHLLLVDLALAQGRYAEARAEAETFVRQHPGEVDAWLAAGNAALFSGALESARERYQRAYEIGPTSGRWGRFSPVLLGYVLWNMGQREEAQRLLNEFERNARGELRRGSESGTLRYGLVAVNTVRGEHREALQWLHDAIAHGWRYEWILARDPLMASVRNDPEFQRLLNEMQAEVGRQRQAAIRGGR